MLLLFFEISYIIPYILCLKIDGIILQFGMEQLINEPTYILPASIFYFLHRFNFFSQTNLVMESGVHSSLHQKYHHQIIYANFNLKIHYPSPHGEEIWYYKNANTNLIQRAINYYPWERSLAENKCLRKGLYIC